MMEFSMRLSPLVLTLALGVSSLGVAHAQQAAVPRSTAAALPKGVGFAYDAKLGQISASGISLNTVTKSAAAPVTTGTVDVTIVVKAVSKFPSGEKLKCSVFVIGGILDLDNGTVDGGLETVNGYGNYIPGGASCTLSVPYSWTLSSTPGADSGLVIAFAASAVNAQGDVQRSSVQVSGIENLPASGTTSKYTFDVVL
jgi:hypothetical protein